MDRLACFFCVGGPPQPAGDMLSAGGTCEFSARSLRSDLSGAPVAPASARASDPVAPPSGIAHASDDAASSMRTGKTHRLKTCATRRGSPEPDTRASITCEPYYREPLQREGRPAAMQRIAAAIDLEARSDRAVLAGLSEAGRFPG